MLNTGLSRLVLVTPREHLTSESYWMAREARGILEGAEVRSTLAEALEGCGLAVGTTRRVGKYRRPAMTPRQAAREALPLLESNDVAIVFGREDSGLSGGELDLCQWVVTIPASEAFPSYNLAQAVLICCYELFLASLGEAAEEGDRLALDRASGPSPRSRRGVPLLAGPAKLEAYYEHLEEVLRSVGFLVGDHAPSIMRTLRRVYGRARLEERDLKILHGILAQMDWYRLRSEEGDVSSPARLSRIRRAEDGDWPAITALLAGAGLPLLGLEAHREGLFVSDPDGVVCGCIALEPWEEGGLLRSLVVREDHRRAGLGRRLVAAVIAEARRRKLPALYLLTLDAATFFGRLGFERITREDVPASVRASEEWGATSCATAVVMRLRLE